MIDLLELANLCKTFPEVQALKGVSFSIRQGEVHALLGENGAGKSTLIKIVTGAQRADRGSVVRLEGRDLTSITPSGAQALGIAVIYQEFNLVPHLSVAENIFLGREPTTLPGVIHRPRLHQDAEALLKRLAVDIAPTCPVEELGVAHRQMVEIAKALSLNARLIFMDEPTASLTDDEARRLFQVIGELKADGVTIVYVSHHLEEVFQLSDRITVLRDGTFVATLDTAATTVDDVIRLMVGRPLTEFFPPRNVPVTNEVLLSVSNLTCPGVVEDVSFELHKGELLGLVGLMGAGRTEVGRMLFGAHRKTSGHIRLQDKPIWPQSPEEARNAGLAMVPEDRRHQGLVLDMGVDQNTTLGNLAAVCRQGFRIDFGREAEVADRYISDLRIKTPSRRQSVRYLSGGNQQKVVVAKWLFVPAHVIIFDDPTRGIDVGAKYEIYGLMNRLVADGLGVLMISSDLPEAMGMCDRLLVMRGGRIVAELGKAAFDQEKIMHYATGGT